MTVMSELNPQPLPPGGALRISAPASVLNNLEIFQKAQAGVLEKAGCPACTSGLNLLWQTFTDFVVNEAGEVSPVAGGQLAAG
jgi:hypothetical protein